jgi:hypothetical protein
MSTTDGPGIEESVRRRYAELAETAVEGGTCCTSDEQAVFGKSRYDLQDLGDLPEEAVKASLGCGNPAFVADLAAGEVVLDLGSGGGIDVILSARRVGPTGHAWPIRRRDLAVFGWAWPTYLCLTSLARSATSMVGSSLSMATNGHRRPASSPGRSPHISPVSHMAGFGSSGMAWSKMPLT